MELLPKELQYSIVNSRRHLGIFTRLKVPEFLKTELECVYKKRVCEQYGTMVHIGSNRGGSTTYRFLHKATDSWIAHREFGEVDGTFMETYFIWFMNDRWNHVGKVRSCN